MQRAERLRVAEKRPAKGIAMTIDVLGQRVEHDVRPVLKRSLERGRGEGAVDCNRYAARVSALGNCRDVEDAAQRIDRRLEENKPGPLGDRGIEILWIAQIDRDDLDAEARDRLFDHGKRVRIKRLVDNEFITLGQE